MEERPISAISTSAGKPFAPTAESGPSGHATTAAVTPIAADRPSSHTRAEGGASQDNIHTVQTNRCTASKPMRTNGERSAPFHENAMPAAQTLDMARAA